MTLGERIKKIRKEKDLTQQALADLIGIKQNSIALIESGKRNPSDQVILSICRTFNVSESWLRDGDGEMFISVAPDEFTELAQRHPTLTHESLVFIEKLVQQSPENQTIIMGFLRDVVAGFGDVPAGTLANQVSRDQLHATLDAQLDQEKEATDESAVS